MTRLDRLIEAERKLIGKSSYARKSTSLLMKLINVVVGLFNKYFMTRYTTTIGTTTYIADSLLTPNGDNEEAIQVELHEFVHKWDYVHGKVKFVFGYLFSGKRRSLYELRGYTMNMYWYWLRARLVVDPNEYVKYFTGPDYLWMARDGEWVWKELASRQRMFMENEEAFLSLPGSEPYKFAKEFMKTEGLLYGQQAESTSQLAN